MSAKNVNTTKPQVEAASRQSGHFLTGLFGGAMIGTAAGVLFAPELNAALRTLRRQLTDAAGDAGDAAAERYREATTRVGDAVDDLQKKSRSVYGKTLSVVARGAEDVAERAADAQIELERSASEAARGAL